MSQIESATQDTPTPSSTAQALVTKLAQEAKAASHTLAQASEEKIKQVLDAIAESLNESQSTIIQANKKDISAAKEKNLSPALIDRLMLDEARIISMANSVKAVSNLKDPTGQILWETRRPNGLHIQRISCPIGLLGMIYESRPNVTIDAAALCLKSHNSVILRGGSESLHSALALHAIVQKCLEDNTMPQSSVSMISTPDRAAVGAMLKADKYIDVIIPRGGQSLIERVMNEARMPVFGHLNGICHTYIHSSAAPEMATKVTLNAKLRRTGICGATETLLIDKNTPPSLAKAVLETLLDSGCNIYGDKHAQEIDKRISPASPADWTTEYLDAKLSCKFVNDINEAIEHINTFGSHHTDSIIAQDKDAAARFLKSVDSGIVMHNTSTQFADGGEFGMGAEIGIATGKMHARGPVGLEQLCTYKYNVHGSGQTRP
ncbi:MAG: glutamate-5-semialdehyde dehydrogenase [Alphaproteobacteria bacterium]